MQEEPLDNFCGKSNQCFKEENTVYGHRNSMSHSQCKICTKALPRDRLIDITHAFTSHSTIAETLARFADIEVKLASHPTLNEGFICLETCYDRLLTAIEFQDLVRNVFELLATENGEIEERDSAEWDSNSMETIGAHDMLDRDVECRLKPEECSETENVKLLGRPFVIAKLDYVKTHMRFNNLEYVELSGPMCCGCDFIAKYTNSLMDHMTAKHNNRTNGSNDSFVCDVCYETCEDERQLQAHRQWFLNTEIYLCKYCSYGFTCKENLTQHMGVCIEQIECTNVDDKLATGNALETMEGYQVVEHIADKEREESQDDLVTKIKHRDDHGDLYNGKTAAIVPLNCESTETNGYGCCFLRCNATFDRETDLDLHVQELHAIRQRIHRSERTSDRYVCATCQLNFKSVKTLKRHRNGWKRKQKNVCSHCGAGFVTPGALKDHVQLLHIDPSPQFRCECCGKPFRKQSLLKLHLVTHQQDRRYGCDQCEARFHFGYQLKKHQQAVHTIVFPYECKHCNRKMPNKHRYDLHMRMHTGEKPYACRHDCGRNFSHATDRRRHEMVAHTGEKPHRCSSCSMAYVRHRELQQHYRHFPAHEGFERSE